MAMAEYDVKKYVEIKKLDIITFYNVYDRWLRHLEEKLEAQRNAQNNH